MYIAKHIKCNVKAINKIARGVFQMKDEEYYTIEDDLLIDIKAARDQLDMDLEFDGQEFMENLLYMGFDR